jgi:hypothetical protein
MFIEPGSPFPGNVNAVKLMSRIADMRSARPGPLGDSLSWVVGNKDEGGALKLVPRGNEAGPSPQGMSYDHRVAITVDFS